MTKLAAVLLALSACASQAKVFYSSRSYLTLEQSTGAAQHDATAAAREVTRLFAIRGYALADQRTDPGNGQLVLKLTKSVRAIPTAQGDDEDVFSARDVGSAFYVWITPTGASASTISLLGKPTLANQEPCTADGIPLPCTRLELLQDFVSRFMSGRAEADVVHGVISELQLEGFVATATAPRA